MPTFRQDTKIGGMVPKMKTDDYNDQSVTEEKLKDGAITTRKIADGSVTKDKLQDKTIGVEKLDNELRQAIAAATGLPENLVETIQNVDDTLKNHQRQLDDKQSQIDDKQQQITANDEDISLLQTRSTQMEETIKGIAATGGASRATAVTYDNKKSGLTALNAQAAIDETNTKLSDLSATINKESELGVAQHFVKDDFTTKVEVKETNFFYPADAVKLICTNKSSKDSWFSIGTFGSDDSESEIQSKNIKAGESLVIDRTEQYSGNGYWCKSIGNAKGKFEVYRTDPKVTKNTKELAKKIDKTSISQESGVSEDKVMSQKAVSGYINKVSKDVSNLKSSVVSEQKVSFLSSEKAVVPSVANQATILQFSPISNFNGKKLIFEITPDGIVNQENVNLYFALNGQNTKRIAELGSVSGTEKKVYSVDCNLDFKFNQIWIYPTTNGTSGNIKIECSYINETSIKSDVDTLKSEVEAIESRAKMYVGANREYTKFTDGLAAAVAKRNVDLYVDAGTYDIVAELTVAKIDSDSAAGYYGPKIGRGVRIFFSQGAKIIANYTGTLNASLERFSPLNAIETTDIGGSDFEIHGGEFECTNTRYVVHDECNGKGSYKHLYDNCRMILDNRNKTYFKTCQCIGGGLGEFADIQIIGGYYESKSIDINKSNLDQTISYHNPQPNFGSNFCNSVLIKDAYIKDGTIIVSQLGDSLKYSTFVVNNCSMTKAPYINGENDAGTGRFRMQSWNNDIRNS